MALGLSYLHNYTPFIVHGELNATTVLLSPYMTAKISYLGMSKILRLTQANMTSIAQTSGTSAYLAPEITTGTALQFNPSIDVYSFGILMTQVFAGKQPSPASIYETPLASGAESEVEGVDKNHPMVGTILQCTSKSPEQRPHIDQTAKLLADKVADYPSTYAHRLEFLTHLMASKESPKTDTKESVHVREKLRLKQEKSLAQSGELKRLKMEKERLSKQLIVDSKLAGKVIHDFQELEKHVEQGI